MSEFGQERDLQRYETLQTLGQGAYGRVYRARDTATGNYIAMKRINLDLDTEGVPTTVLREVCLLRELNHNHIVELHDVVVTDSRLYLIFEYLDKDLRKLLDDTNSLEPNLIRNIMY